MYKKDLIWRFLTDSSDILHIHFITAKNILLNRTDGIYLFLDLSPKNPASVSPAFQNSIFNIKKIEIWSKFFNLISHCLVIVEISGQILNVGKPIFIVF